MLQQRIVVNTQVREKDLRDYYVFNSIFMSRTQIPIAMAGVCLAPIMIYEGAVLVGSLILAICAVYAYSFFYSTNKFMKRNSWQIGQRYRIIVDKRRGVTLEEHDMYNIEEFSWKQIRHTGENKRMFVLLMDKGAVFLPKLDMDPEDVTFLQRLCLGKKGSKHKRNF